MLQIGGMAVLALLICLGLVAFSSPQLPILGLPVVEHLGRYSEVPGIIRGQKAERNIAFHDRKDIKYVRSANPVIHPRNAAAVTDERPIVFGFYVNWDPASLASLRANLQSITHLVPEWLTLANAKGGLTDESDPQVVRICSDAHMPVLVMVTNFRDGWQGKELHDLLGNAAAKENLVDNVVKNVEEHRLAGATMDFEELPSGDRARMVQFMSDLKSRLAAKKLILAEAVPADDDAYDLKQLGSIVDYIVPMVYDEHYQSGEPGPVASEDWFETQIDKLAKVLPAEKTVIGVGAYGYDWVIGGTAATELSFQQVISAARSQKAQVSWDNDQQNPVLRYKSSVSGQSHEVWFLDGVSGLNQIQTVDGAGFRGIGIWRLGGEDQELWRALPNQQWPGEHFNAAPLESLSSLKIPDRYGDGEIVRVVDIPRDGQRKVWQDSNGDYAETYQQLPTYFTLENNGPGEGQGKQLVLTFDDGPDPEWTPKILDVLKSKKAPATFFVIGLNAESFPELVSREYREGHLVGNHTYTHPNIATTGAERTRLELNLTQRVIEFATGHSTTLFRPPYNADNEPTTGAEVDPIWRAQQLGYTMIGERIDPQDWQPGTKAAAIVQDVIGDKDTGHVILLHDGGGDRQATLDALPQIIDRLRGQGYQFVGLDTFMGQTEAKLMPKPSGKESEFAGLEGSALITKGSFQKAIGLLFLVAIYLTMARSFVFGSLAIAQKLRLKQARFDAGFTPPVSVVIAAYNEEKVVTKTVASILASDYPDFEIVVVDDGSKDATSEVLLKAYANHPRVRLFRQPNGGKSSALNRAMAEARHEILVALDADTVFDRQAMRKLARHFANPKVGAVSGNARVGNKHNWLTRFQSIEYICGFNLDRRALAVLNAITVVPGAVGAWRKSLILKVGGFGHETLAEDTDVTLSIRRLSYEIRYEEGAIAYTEAPETTGALAKQRFRWAFGTLQAAWKHRDALFVPKYGALAFVALPSIWVFQVLLAMLSPLAEVAMIIALVAGNWRVVLLYYVAFFAIDLLSAVLAFVLEGEPLWDLLLFVPQRLYYRALMNYILMKSLLYALRGRLVAWGKLERTASVEARN